MVKSYRYTIQIYKTLLQKSIQKFIDKTRVFFFHFSVISFSKLLEWVFFFNFYK